jgi:hypothetical protein
MSSISSIFGPTQSVAAVLHSPDLALDLIPYLERHHELRTFGSVEALLGDAGLRGPDCVLLEIPDSGASPLVLTEIVRRHPTVTVVGIARVRGGIWPELCAFAHAGADEVILLPYDEPSAAISRAVRGNLLPRARRALLTRLPEILPEARAELICAAVNIMGPGLNVDALARSLGVNRRTLSNRTASIGLPHPKLIVAYARLLTGWQLLQDQRTRSVAEAVKLIGFPSLRPFRIALMRLLGLSLAQFRTVSLEVLADRMTLSPPSIRQNAS